MAKEILFDQEARVLRRHLSAPAEDTLDPGAGDRDPFAQRLEQSGRREQRIDGAVLEDLRHQDDRALLVRAATYRR